MISQSKGTYPKVSADSFLPGSVMAFPAILEGLHHRQRRCTALVRWYRQERGRYQVYTQFSIAQYESQDGQAGRQLFGI